MYLNVRRLKRSWGAALLIGSLMATASANTADDAALPACFAPYGSRLNLVALLDYAPLAPSMPVGAKHVVLSRFEEEMTRGGDHKRFEFTPAGKLAVFDPGAGFSIHLHHSGTSVRTVWKSGKAPTDNLPRLEFEIALQANGDVVMEPGKDSAQTVKVDASNCRVENVFMTHQLGSDGQIASVSGSTNATWTYNEARELTKVVIRDIDESPAAEKNIEYKVRERRNARGHWIQRDFEGADQFTIRRKIAYYDEAN